ncbi:MAG TPA: serine/threonine-protein kinase [Halomicronema sp.]
MPQSFSLTSVYCINPDCPRPSSQRWGNRFCQSCGTSLQLQDRYVPLQQLGSGGFAVTYTVFDLVSQTERVLKVLIESSEQALRLFEQEAQVLASLRHGGIPRVEVDNYFGVQVINPSRRVLPCMVMEKINGQTLEEVLERYPQGCPEVLAVGWLYQALDILQLLHRRGIIHRDLKPANLMLRRETQQLVAIDFGGVKQLSSHLYKGTQNQGASISTRLISPGYSPPEQIAGGVVGPQADFYALGRTFVHLLTGRYPGELDDPLTGVCRWRSHVQVNPGLGDLLDEMISLVPSNRPASARELLGRLAKISRRRKRVAKALRSFDVVLSFVKLIITPFVLIGEVLYKLLAGLTKNFWKILIYTFQAVLDTLLGMIMAGLGGSMGAGIGFWLVYGVPVGKRLAVWLTANLAYFESDIVIEPVFFLFVIAGLGTALGLTESGSFSQQRKFWRAGFLGILGYIVGWFFAQTIPPSSVQILNQFMGFSAIGIASLTLGLGLPKHHLLLGSLAAMGTAVFMLVFLTLFPLELSFLFKSSALPGKLGWEAFVACLGFFAFLGSSGAFCLGWVYYVLIPVLRFLGFR